MDSERNDTPHPSPDTLGSAEYRARLMTKLNCLIAVLEVAITKISKSMDLPGANEERLLKIRSNLENTLSICQRARQTLDRSATGRLAGRTKDEGKGRMTARDYVELTSIDEYRKFKRLPAITREELGKLDLDDLARKLTGS
jgi:hypothetical protein